MHNNLFGLIHFKFKTAGLIALLLVLARQAAFSQNTVEVTFSVQYNGEHRPIDVTRVLIDGNPIPLDVVVTVPEKWLEKVTLDVKNTSKKPIVYGQIILKFPETGTGASDRPIFTTASALGRRPLTDYRRKDGTMHDVPSSAAKRAEMSIAPGARMHFSFAGDVTSIGEAERLSGGPIHKVILVPYDFSFADGTNPHFSHRDW
jgi:hypothetical protein